MAKLNFMMTVSYDGTRYQGWQRLPNSSETIQGKLEAVIGRMLGTKIEIIGSGRTDKGAHAVSQAANFIIEDDKGLILNEKDMILYINKYLPDDIAVTSLKRASERFHARYNCKAKTYRYCVDLNPIQDVFDIRYRFHFPHEIDLEAMKRAAMHLTGLKDFTSFTSAKPKDKSFVREIYSIDIILKDKGKLDFIIKGDGFLYNMVRIIVGTLLEVGTDKRIPAEIPEILALKKREAAGFTAPSHGLFLMDVEY